jgi:hypothetical protein
MIKIFAINFAIYMGKDIFNKKIQKNDLIINLLGIGNIFIFNLIPFRAQPCTSFINKSTKMLPQFRFKP